MQGPRAWLSAVAKRHIVQVGIVYLGVAWFFIQAVGFFTEQYALPVKLLNVAILLALLGFPAALVIAWFHGERGHQSVQKSEATILLTLAVLAAIGTYRLSVADEPILGGGPAATLADLGRSSIAVLPFTNNTGADSLDWLGPGLSDMLTTSFAQLPEVRVVSPQRLFDLLHEEGRDETDQIPQDVALEIVERSGARAMVRGTILGDGDALAIDAQLIDVADGTVIGAERARGSDVFALVDTVAARLSGRLRGEDTPSEQVIDDMTPIADLAGNIEAYRAYVDGLRSKWKLLQPDDIEGRYWLESMYEMMPGREADRQLVLEEIVAIDPSSAPAIGSLAALALLRGDLEAADSLSQRYLELDPQAADAHALRGRLHEIKEHHEDAREAYREAVRLRPDYVRALDHLVRTALLDGQPAVARRELAGFLESDNTDVRVEARLLTGDTYLWEGDLDAALDQYRRAEAIAIDRDRQDLRTRSIESIVAVASNMGEGDAAIEGMTFRPFGVPSMVERAVGLLDLDRPEKADKILEAARAEFMNDTARLFPIDYYALLYGRARHQEAIGNRGKAGQMYARLVEAWGEAIPRVPLVSDTPERLAVIGG